MEEMQSLIRRIEADHDDLQAWLKLGELVDDPQKQRDCREQVTRINNQQFGIDTVIPCEYCGISMRVLPGDNEVPEEAVCPVCHRTKKVLVTKPPAGHPARLAVPAERMTGSAKLLQNQLTLIAILGSNLLPLVGILFLGWTMASVMILYWIENVIVGLFSVLKMATAQAGGLFGKLMLIPFFCVHFGGFCAGHAVFIYVIFLVNFSRNWSWQGLLAEMWIPVLGMLLSYGISYVQHYRREGMYRYATLQSLMFEPYPRVLALHAGLILGGILVAMLGSPIGIVVMLVLLKTIAEVLMYRSSLKRWHAKTRKIVLDIS